jgi:hypothetical protein
MPKFGKSPLTPLFQRGELTVEIVELSHPYPAKFYFLSWMIPPLKKGEQGGFELFTAASTREVAVSPV